MDYWKHQIQTFNFVKTATRIVRTLTENIELAPFPASGSVVVVVVVMVVVVVVVSGSVVVVVVVVSGSVVVVVVVPLLASHPTWKAPGHLPSSGPHIQSQVSSLEAWLTYTIRPSSQVLVSYFPFSMQNLK